MNYQTLIPDLNITQFPGMLNLCRGYFSIIKSIANSVVTLPNRCFLTKQKYNISYTCIYKR